MLLILVVVVSLSKQSIAQHLGATNIRVQYVTCLRTSYTSHWSDEVLGTDVPVRHSRSNNGFALAFVFAFYNSYVGEVSVLDGRKISKDLDGTSNVICAKLCKGSDLSPVKGCGHQRFVEARLTVVILD